MVRKLTNQQQSDRQQKGTEFDRSGQRKQHVGQPERGRVGLACPDWGYADPEDEASVKYMAVDGAHRGPAHAVNAELVAREGNFDLLAGEAGGREAIAIPRPRPPAGLTPHRPCAADRAPGRVSRTDREL